MSSELKKSLVRFVQHTMWGQEWHLEEEYSLISLGSWSFP